MNYQVEIGRGKRARRAYSLDDIALIPARRTRDPEDVTVSWQFDAYHFDIPIIAAPMDSAMNPENAIEFSNLGGLGTIDLDGIWTRYRDPRSVLEEIAELPHGESTQRLQQIYSEPIKDELIIERLQQLREAGVVVAGRLSPQRVLRHWRAAVEGGLDIFIIRGSTVSAEHVSSRREPLNLKSFIYEIDVPVIVGGVATHPAALHLMRTGASGILVGFGGGAAHSARQSLGIHAPIATAIADVAAARRDYMDESGGRYVHVIADGGVGRSGDMIKAIACGADAVMLGAALARSTEAPGQGWHWGSEATHPEMPRGHRAPVDTVGSMRRILYGPSARDDGYLNFVGALQRTMATTGYAEVKDLQRVEVVVSPYHRT